MSVVSYKGYQGSVTFEDGRLYIQVLHVDDLLTAECVSAEDVQREFEDLVDDYLETCAELGRDPKKPFKGTFNVRMTPHLHKQAAMAAAKAALSLNAWIVQGVEEKLSRGERHPNERLHATVEAVLQVREALAASPFRPDHNLQNLQTQMAEFLSHGSYLSREPIVKGEPEMVGFRPYEVS